MTLFHFASLLCAVGGALLLGVFLAEYGVVAMLVGVIAGLAGGWFVGPLLVLGIFVVGILVEEGPRAAIEFLRRRPKV